MADKIPATGKWEDSDYPGKFSMKAAREMARRSRDRTPGWAEGSEQDRISKRIYGATAAKEMIGATIQKNRKKRAEKKAAKKEHNPY